MGRTIYIGRKSEHLGKTAFSLLLRLKNFGIGRMLTRHEFDAFPEPSFHVVKRVEPSMDPEHKFGTIWCETVVRGQRLPGVRPIHVTYRPDFRLIPRDEEKDFIGDYKITNLGDEVNILPRDYTVPPLMARYLQRHRKLAYSEKIDDTKKAEFAIPFVYKNARDSNRKEETELFWIANRVAKDESEKPTVEFDGRYHFNDEYLQLCNKKSASETN